MLMETKSATVANSVHNNPLKLEKLTSPHQLGTIFSIDSSLDVIIPKRYIPSKISLSEKSKPTEIEINAVILMEGDVPHCVQLKLSISV